ncbi:MAG: aspartate aminotransferase family protein [Chitinophagaceae bacterium]|nr:MAG: aspartate aminotransferase family protein [Chitinophagaceae bacterium]
MYQQLSIDRAAFDSLLSSVRDRALAHLGALNHLPASRPHSSTTSGSAKLPEEGAGAAAAIDAFFEQHADKLVASPGPRYWGFVTGGATPAALAGDWLTSVFDQNTQSVAGPGDRSAEVEVETIGLLLDLLGLPRHFNGGFVTGATMANFTGLVVGRQWAGEKLGKNIAREGVGEGVVVLSATPHSSAVKCLSMMGLGSASLVPVATLPGDREAIDIADLERQLQAHAGKGIILVSSGGTVNSVDFDDMNAIASLRKQYSFFWHIDAAFGAFAALSPEHASLLAGWEAADSIAIDCHKWLNVPYDSAFYLVRKEHARAQLQSFQNSNAPYLGDPEQNFTYLNFGPENSRRFRALPVWLTLKAYGREGYHQIVSDSIRYAQLFAQKLAAQTDFRIVAPVHLNVVCFSLKRDTPSLETVLRRLNAAGLVFVTPSVFNGTPCLRAAFVNWMTSEEDIDIAIRALRSAVAEE